MTKIEIKPGLKINRLLVIEIVENSKSRNKKCLCKCDCGNEKIIDTYSLQTEKTKSCGCLSRELITKMNLKHGQSSGDNAKISSEYRAWKSIKDRCYNKNNISYKYYGGRGITVSQEWLNSFETFFQDMGKKSTPKHSIERDDVNGNYCKENCRWATIEEQHNNTRRSRFIEYNGKTQTLNQWAKELNTGRKNITYRLNKGISVEETFSIFLAKLNKSD
jgi:hypothetical protein